MNGLTASQSPSNTAWSDLRVQIGTNVSGVLAQRVQALHGLQCRANMPRRMRATPSTVGYLECCADTTVGPVGAAEDDASGNATRGIPGVPS
jgi:hypothetical protein